MTYMRAKLKLYILLWALLKKPLWQLSIYVWKLWPTLFSKHCICSCPANFLCDTLTRLWVKAIWNMLFFLLFQGPLLGPWRCKGSTTYTDLFSSSRTTNFESHLNIRVFCLFYSNVMLVYRFWYCKTIWWNTEIFERNVVK